MGQKFWRLLYKGTMSCRLTYREKHLAGRVDLVATKEYFQDEIRNFVQFVHLRQNLTSIISKYERQNKKKRILMFILFLVTKDRKY